MFVVRRTVHLLLRLVLYWPNLVEGRNADVRREFRINLKCIVLYASGSRLICPLHEFSVLFASRVINNAHGVN